MSGGVDLLRRGTAWSIVLLLCAGCGEAGPARYTLSGNVTFEGQPVPAGEVRIEPDASRGATGPQSVAQIAGGRFDTLVVAGPVVIRVEAFDGVAQGESRLGMPLGAPVSQTADLPPHDSRMDFEIPSAAE